MYKSQKILTGITESHTTACSRLIIGCRSGHIERNHTLVLIPDICHTVDVFIFTGYCKTCQQILPVIIQFCKSRHSLIHCIKAFDQGFCRCLIDDSRCFPFIICRVLTISQHKYKFFFFTWYQFNIDLMCCDRIPSTCYGIAAFFLTHSFRKSISITSTEKSISACIKIVNRSVNSKETVMSSSFSVLRLMINCASLHFHFADT